MMTLTSRDNNEDKKVLDSGLLKLQYLYELIDNLFKISNIHCIKDNHDTDQVMGQTEKNLNNHDTKNEYHCIIINDYAALKKHIN